MKNKYYTPEIEEFHVNFKYEKASINNNYTIVNWEKTKFLENDIPLDLINKYPQWQRVKYLDKKDIESFGFKLKGDLFHKNNLTLQVHDNYKITIRYKNNDEYRTLVEQITIKNKSELKKLLKQLKIN